MLRIRKSATASRTSRSNPIGIQGERCASRLAGHIGHHFPPGGHRSGGRFAAGAWFALLRHIPSILPGSTVGDLCVVVIQGHLLGTVPDVRPGVRRYVRLTGHAVASLHASAACRIAAGFRHAFAATHAGGARVTRAIGRVACRGESLQIVAQPLLVVGPASAAQVDHPISEK
jgi:hypothetical protein